MTVTENGELPGLTAGLRIGGQVVKGHAAPIDVTNPATGEVFAQVCRCRRAGHRSGRPSSPRDLPVGRVARPPHP